VNELERFKAIVHYEKPEYVPIFGFPGAPGMSRGCMRKTWERLVATGMPAEVGSHDLDEKERVDSWKRYWGTADPMTLDFHLQRDVPGFETTSRVEGEYEIIESESGAVTRQVVDNAATYSMPDFITYPVRDRDSWEFYRQRQTPRGKRPADEMEERCRAYDGRDRPLVVSAGGTVGSVRSLMGPEAACTALYDDPELVRDIMRWKLDMTREYVFPLIERLRPEVVGLWEDICGNHAMMVSPSQFEEFGGDYYRETCAVARAHGADLVTVDSDGNVGELVPLLASFGVNGLYPFEAKGNADLLALREKLPEFVMFGWLEKEAVNEGNEDGIEREIMSKVPPMLERGRYFPNGDHGIQPLVTFEGMCTFMTILHEVCGNPEGTFPRTR
jgi:uroporphyrinogen-III decarboxylase